MLLSPVTDRFPALWVACVLGLFCTAGSSLGQVPKIGDVQKLKVITVSLQVGSTEKETKQVIYTPPPGWYVRSHVVECSVKQGNVSYSVNTVPQNWGWVSEDRLDDTSNQLLEVGGQAQHLGLNAKLKQDRARLLADSHKMRSSHHALVLEAAVKGEGFLKGAGSLQLSVIAELVYIGVEESPVRIQELPQAKIRW